MNEVFVHLPCDWKNAEAEWCGQLQHRAGLFWNASCFESFESLNEWIVFVSLWIIWKLNNGTIIISIEYFSFILFVIWYNKKQLIIWSEWKKVKRKLHSCLIPKLMMCGVNIFWKQKMFSVDQLVILSFVQSILVNCCESNILIKSRYHVTSINLKKCWVVILSRSDHDY